MELDRETAVERVLLEYIERFGLTESARELFVESSLSNPRDLPEISERVSRGPSAETSPVGLGSTLSELKGEGG